MRILLYAPNYLPATRYGGPVQSSHGLAKALVELGHEVHVFTTNVDGPSLLDVPVETAIELDGVIVRYFGLSLPERIYYSPGMGRAIDAEIGTFDVVHINGMFLWPGPRTTRAAQRAGVAYVVSPRGMLVPELIAAKSSRAKRLWIQLFERSGLASAAAIHVTSADEADSLRGLGLDLAPLAIIGNGVDLPKDLPSSDDIEHIWAGIPRGRRIVLLGRLDWTKGVDLAIDAVAKVPDAFLLIAGHDQIGLRKVLESRLSKGRFLGPVEGKRKWALLAGADVLLASSIKESFGISVAEALAIGTPVVCTAGVGAAPIVASIDSQCVVLRTREAIAETLTSLLSDATRRKAYGRRSRALMAADYTWLTVARRMEEVYTAAIAKTCRRRAS